MSISLVAPVGLFVEVRVEDVAQREPGAHVPEARDRFGADVPERHLSTEKVMRSVSGSQAVMVHLMISCYMDNGGIIWFMFI